MREYRAPRPGNAPRMEPDQQQGPDERPAESPAADIEPDEAVPEEATGAETPQPPGTDHVVEEKGQD
jgi:hypothetical protein